MDLLDSLNILLRRWMLTIPLLVLTIAGVVAGYFVLPWSYEAKSTVVLLASPYQSKQAGGNPYLLFDGSLTVTAEVVGREVMSDEVAARMKARKLTSEYEVMVAPDSVGPVLSIDVTGPDPADVRGTQAALTEEVVRRLARIQTDAGVDQQARIGVSDVSTTPPTRQPKGKLRTLAMLLFMGLVATIVVPLSAEAMVSRRRGRPEAATRTPAEVRSPAHAQSVDTSRLANGWSAGGPGDSHATQALATHSSQAPRTTRPARTARADHLVRTGRSPVVPLRISSSERDL